MNHFENHLSVDTVDGRDPAPPRMMIIPLLIGFIHPRWLAGFQPSTVSWKKIKPSATSKDLEKFAASARTELGKVRRIQAGFMRKVGINGLGVGS